MELLKVQQAMAPQLQKEILTAPLMVRTALQDYFGRVDQEFAAQGFVHCRKVGAIC
jgi:hypothetical protein